MKVELFEKPKKGATIIEGFSGFGLVGTIVAEYLIDHLKAKQIGKFVSEKIPAIVAIHKGEVVEPFAIFYAPQENIIIFRAIASVKGLEWELADAALQLSGDVNAKEIVEIEGVGGMEGKVQAPKAFYFTLSPERKKKLESFGLELLKEGIIVGVTASLLSKVKEGTFIFAESYSDFPDSRAAAKVIEVLDKYLSLKVDYKPLIGKAETFEKKVKTLLSKTAAVTQEQEKKEGEAYIG